jgi:hypothetical protein
VQAQAESLHHPVHCLVYTTVPGFQARYRWMLPPSEAAAGRMHACILTCKTRGFEPLRHEI